MLNGLSFPGKLSDLVLTSNKIAEQLISFSGFCSRKTYHARWAFERNIAVRHMQ